MASAARIRWVVQYHPDTPALHTSRYFCKWLPPTPDARCTTIIQSHPRDLGARTSRFGCDRRSRSPCVSPIPRTLTAVTNLAHALRSSPNTFARVAHIVWMGGALDHPGNTSPCAEFNCFADPYAASQILEAVRAGSVDLIMAPLDVTTPHQIPFTDLIHPSVIAAASLNPPQPNGHNDINDPLDGAISTPTEKLASRARLLSTDSGHPSPLRAFVSAMLLRVRDLQASFGLPDAMEMHDPVAAWYAIADASSPALSSLSSASRSARGPPRCPPGWSLQQRDFKVERHGELTRGMCVVDRRGTGDNNTFRTDNERLKAMKIGDDARGRGRSAAIEENHAKRDRDGSDVIKAEKLPWVIVGTPGSEELRSVLLGRVFGDVL